MKRKQLFIVFLFLHSLSGFAQINGIWNVRNFGAKGDGKTKDTKAIQTAIDQCHKAGGGQVLLHNGQFLISTIYLKSNVTLHIESGAVLLGSSELDDYLNIKTIYPSTHGDNKSGKSMIFAEGQENIAISGKGTINGQGIELFRKNPKGVRVSNASRPHILHFRNCKNVKVQDISLYNASSWVQFYQSCENLLIDGITVESRENKDIEKPRFADVPGMETDGCDIVDCRNVRIVNCSINSDDDGIAFKSFKPNGGCYNVAVSNCMITSNASGIKIGTESAGAFKDFTIDNCVVYDTRNAGIGLMTVDGAAMERIIISNISMRNIKGTAIFVRLGNRAKIYQGTGPAPMAKLKDILIRNVYGTDIERYGCSITGLQEAPVEGIVLDNIRLTFKGGDSPFYYEGNKEKPVKSRSVDDIPEKENGYPHGAMFDKLPAYGFYIRHAKDVTFNNIHLGFAEEDKRSALIADDVQGLLINGLRAQSTAESPSLLHFKNVRQASVSHSGSINEVPVFLQVSGEQTKDIQLHDNQSGNAKKIISSADVSLLGKVEIK